MKLKDFRRYSEEVRGFMELHIDEYYNLGVCWYLSDIPGYGIDDKFSYFFAPRTLKTNKSKGGIDGNLYYWLGHQVSKNDDVRRTFFDMFIEVSIIEKWYKDY